jgi:glucose-6-phosphate isomerase
MNVNLGKYSSDVEAAMVDMKRRDVVRRLWRKDHNVWDPDPTEIANRLGWLTVTELMREKVPALESFASEVREAGFRHIILLGMGGSSLGPEVLRATFGGIPGYPEFVVLDSALPSCVQSVAEAIDPARTLFLISSKSGNTIEPLSLFYHFRTLVASAIGKEKAGKSFVAITDRGTPLAGLAEETGFRHLFLNPPDIGGRYSVLSYFGLVPAALMGINIASLLDRAENIRDQCMSYITIHENPGVSLGVIIGTMALLGKDKLTLVTSPSISSFGLWLEQLIAESTGKEGKGIIPIVGEPMIEPSHYGNDRLFVYLRLHNDSDSAADETIRRTQSSGQPVLVLEMRDKYDVGSEFFRWQFATAIAGAQLSINPFNQPNVETSKRATGQVLQEFLTYGHLPQVEVAHSLAGLLAEADIGNYLAILAYIRQTAEVDETLVALRGKVSELYNIATTIGYGPRYLHSTGQLHKGGPPTGLFLVINTSYEKDLPIPGQPYSFGTLADAQAIGDVEALQLSGRRVAMIHSEREDAVTSSTLSLDGNFRCN